MGVRAELSEGIIETPGVISNDGSVIVEAMP
jgi:hypothetical protein